MVGPPPPPPPPPPPSAVLPSSWRQTANAQRAPVQSSPKPPPVHSQRPSVDASALQHAATHLRKTQHGQSLRSDEPRVSDGRVDGQTECPPRRDWQNGAQQQSMGANPAREEMAAASPRADFARPLGHVRRPADSLNAESSPQRFVSTTTFSSSDYSSPTTRLINNSLPPYSSPYSSSLASSSSYASPFLHSSSSSSSWVTQIDNTYREHSASPAPHSLYAVPTRASPQPARTPPPPAHGDGLLYSAINKSSTTSSPPLASSHPSSGSAAPSRSDFARELRDQGLTDRQRVANEQKSERRLDPIPINADSILQASRDGDEISRLVNQMSAAMNRPTTGAAPAAAPPPVQPTRPRPAPSPTRTTTTTTDTVTTKQATQSLKGNVCVNCKQEITNDKPGCTALNQVFHVSCFTCSKCGDQLAGSSFYNVDGKPICERDYVESLERCAKCNQAISDRLLRAVGGAFHVHCFTCVVCNIALDGIPFTVDPENRVHCVPCFHEAFAPRCCVCSKPIVPQDGEKESVRVVAMEKSFHVECYRCEDCGTQLSSKVEGQGCYPLDSHLYCKTCNGNRLRVLASS
ncbi:hypothetical protein PFISCL1PPCAC_8122 [Pristionchus fissidentatus]|uniref:LIM zinc-binding domain-containing protein n=1 Tax=Pristionchus fissidentatus TaxID=1538716 RepID=A0AAV5VE06_9BILA|nr:hypothetical protein PFISCL1PPCAC_8122 [Pristionchus fissidentatus]